MTSDALKLRFVHYAPNGEAYHVGRREATSRFVGTLHTHDFAEVMWIEQGELAHLVNGTRQTLKAGDIVFIRPEDVHKLGGAEFVQVNVAFWRETVSFLERRYFAAGSRSPWDHDGVPTTYRLDRRQLARLAELSRLLSGAPPTRLLLDRFLLELLHEVVGPAVPRTVPPWLHDALGRFAADPDALAGGVRQLAMLAGRSREHVNRVARVTTGRTATELVNDARLARAAAELAMTDQPIARIAADCGLPNLSHFYRLFNTRFGITPRQLRLRHRAIM